MVAALHLARQRGTISRRSLSGWRTWFISMGRCRAEAARGQGGCSHRRRQEERGRSQALCAAGGHWRRGSGGRRDAGGAGGAVGYMLAQAAEEASLMTATGAKPPGATDEASAAAGCAADVRLDCAALRPAESRALGQCGPAVVVADGAAVRTVLANPDAAVLDICCGTGDMTMALLKRRPRGAADSGGGFCARDAEPRSAEVCARRPGAPYAVPLEADALHLPLRDPRRWI
jgi:hypothetical protein